MALSYKNVGTIGSPAWGDANYTPEQLQRQRAWNDFSTYYGLDGATSQYMGNGKWAQTWDDVGDNAGGIYLVNAPEFTPDWVRPGSQPAPQPQTVNPGVTAVAPPKPTAEQDAIDAITSRGSRYDEVQAVNPSAGTQQSSLPNGDSITGRAGSPEDYMFDENGFLATAWDPTLGAIDYDTGTVEGRMARMLNEGNPYLQAAQSQAMQQANTRGLLNTSMAVGAGTQAMMNTAMPIAQQDAQAYLQQNLANQQYSNQAGQYNASTLNDLNKTGYTAFLGSEEADRSAQRQGDLNAQSEQLKQSTMLLDEQIKTRLAALQQDFAVELETLKQSYNIMENRDTQMGTMYSEALNSMAGFLNRAELTPQQQSAGIKVIIDNLNAGLQFMAGIGSATAVNNYQSGTSYVPPVPG